MEWISEWISVSSLDGGGDGTSGRADGTGADETGGSHAGVEVKAGLVGFAVIEGPAGVLVWPNLKFKVDESYRPSNALADEVSGNGTLFDRVFASVNRRGVLGTGRGRAVR